MNTILAVMEREIRNYLKRPLFWTGVLIVVLGVYQNVRPYLAIRYVSSEDELKEPAGDAPETVHEADISEGYVPTDEADRRQIWDGLIKENLVSEFQMEQPRAEAVIEEMREMTVKEASEYLEKKYHYFNAFYTWENTGYHQGTREELNAYIRSRLEDKRFSYYFSRKFADFAGLYMGFFAAVMLAALFWQDAGKNTYELLHTKPVRAGEYVLGKTAGGFSVCLLVLGVLALIFWTVCRIFTAGSGFEVRLTDFLTASGLYILPNMLMIVCVYVLISLLFHNPLPAVPLLILYMVYSNMGSRNADGVFGYYGRPLAIMVRFPGPFFETASPPLAVLNQSFLILASAGIIIFCVQLWKRRRI